MTDLVENEEQIEAPHVDSEPTPEVETPKPRVEKRISTLTSKLHHKDQILAQKEAEIETLRASMPKQEVKTPELPSDELKYEDPDKYKQQLNEYHSSIARQAVLEAESEKAKSAEEQRAKEQKVKQQEKYQEVVNSYIETGLKAGISEDKMLANEHVLAEAKLERGLVEQLYSDGSGAQVVDFLADNPEKLAELSAMNPYEAAVSIATEIKPQALSTKSPVSKAPEPAPVTKGGSITPEDDWSRRHPNARID